MKSIETLNLKTVDFVTFEKSENRPAIKLIGKDFQRLQNGKMLNDEVVNMYCSCLKALITPNVFILTSFYYTNLRKTLDFKATAHWIKWLVSVLL